MDINVTKYNLEKYNIHIPGIYKHFKHEDQGTPLNYMYIALYVSEPVKIIDWNKGVCLLPEDVNTDYEKGEQLPICITNGASIHLKELHDEPMVIYISLYNNKLWARKLSEFISKVDKNKYPKIKQDNRFEFIQ